MEFACWSKLFLMHVKNTKSFIVFLNVEKTSFITLVINFQKITDDVLVLS